ncbi:DUF4235 domain-containing protein [Kitasatospora sp. NPDC047058]|uniref:DUF4235 domain-containing protein n=1 Tax=Kitasatospora sp. NPDC047058 TaxID=3155620 RepID=UPI0034022725
MRCTEARSSASWAGPCRAVCVSPGWTDAPVKRRPVGRRPKRASRRIAEGGAVNIATFTRRPLGLLVGTLGGGPAFAVVRRAWRIIGPEEVKKPHTWRRVLLAVAFQCAVFALLKATLGRGPHRRHRKDPSHPR